VLKARVIGEQDVVLAFQRAGLPLRRFTASGTAAQFTASTPKLTPAVVVAVFPTEQAARRSVTSLAINGKRVHAIALRNVRIFVAAQATNDLRRHVSRALVFLRRLR
jgi:hypothetical protein